MIDTKELRRLAEEQQWIGRWYDAGCETLMAERNGEHEEVAHLTPTGLVPYLVAVQPATISELLDRLEGAESDAIEQARLNGMGSEREAALMAKLEAAEKSDAESISMYRKARDERDALRAKVSDSAINVEYLSNLKKSYEELIGELQEERDELRAKIEAMERQAPSHWGCNVLQSDARWKEEVSREAPPEGYFSVRDAFPLYLAPGAQPAPSISPVALHHVIQWLRNGCDPMKAADELEMLAAATEKR